MHISFSEYGGGYFLFLSLLFLALTAPGPHSLCQWRKPRCPQLGKEWLTDLTRWSNHVDGCDISRRRVCCRHLLVYSSLHVEQTIEG
jgi:hypothetical protein